jgi:hypothetical protein
MRTTFLTLTFLIVIAALLAEVAATPLATATRNAKVAAPPSLASLAVIRCDLICVAKVCRNQCH